MDLGSKIYSGAAEFGKINAIFGAIIGSLIGLGLIIGGIYLLIKRPDIQTTDGTSDISPVLIGAILIIVGLIILIGGWLYVALTSKSETFAAAYGTATAIEDIVNILKR